MTDNSWVLWWYSWGSFPLVTIPREGMDVNSRTPTPGPSPIQDYFGEAFHLHSIPCNVGEGQNRIYHQHSQKISREDIPMAILVTDRVEEGNLGMVTIFCQPDQSKMEASDAVYALHQHDSPDPGVVVVRRYINTPYIPGGSSCLLYLDVSTLSGGASSTQFLWDWLCLCRLLPFSGTEVVLPWEEGEIRLKVFLHFQEAFWQSSEEEHCLCNLISLFVPLLAPHPHQEEGTQTEGGSGFHLPSSFYKMSIKPELSWGVSWSRKHRRWLKDMMIGRSNRAGGMKGGKHRWLSRQMPPCTMYFPRQAHMTLSSYCLGVFPPQFPSATWAECWPPPHNRANPSQLPQLHLSLRAYWLQAPQAVWLIHLEINHFHYLPYQISPL